MTNRNELERLLAAAAEGPWEAIGTDSVEGRDWCWLKAQPNSVICVFTKGTGAINGSQSDPMPQANAALTCFLRNNAQHYLSLMDEVERLREALSKADEPHWFYAEGWEEHCLHSPDEAIDLLDFAPGQYVTEVATARPCKSIWCAVRVTDDEDADERYSFTEHSTEEEARQALGETHDR